MAKKKKLHTDTYSNIDWDKAKIFFQRPPVLANKDRKYPSTKEILHVVAAAGVIGALFVFPGAAPGLGALVLGKQKYSRWGTRRVIDRLSRQKYVKVEYLEDGRVTVNLTKQGYIHALTYQLDTMHLEKPKRWDKKWRVIIFDIPENYHRTRDLFRMRLKQLGLYLLQESVFISPYPCFDEVEFLRELYGIPINVEYLLVEKLENDSRVKEYFELT